MYYPQKFQPNRKELTELLTFKSLCGVGGDVVGGFQTINKTSWDCVRVTAQIR